MTFPLDFESRPAVFSMKPWTNTFFGSGTPSREQHRRPEDAVEAADVLADHVNVGGPPLSELRLVGPEADGR